MHLPEHDHDRYYLGMITDEIELARHEEHLLGCLECVARAEESNQYVDVIRQAIIMGGYDLFASRSKPFNANRDECVNPRASRRALCNVGSL